MRRFALWTSIVSFVLVALCSAALFVVPRFMGGQGGASGWTFYTPYSPATSRSWQILEAAILVNSIALPVGLLAASAYMAMAEAELRRLRVDRGFDVASATRIERDKT